MELELCSPLEPLEAFARLADFLVSTPQAQPELSRTYKERFWVFYIEPQEDVSWASLQVLAWGLLCGAHDGLGLYQSGLTPLKAQGPEEHRLILSEYLKVADLDWRELSADDLQLQAAYGRHLNRGTHLENVEYMQRSQARLSHALWETFRTGYSIGLIDSAIVMLWSERPESVA